MLKTLIIIESPNKIKKMKSILGDNYVIMATVGHIIDLKENCLSININNKYEPEYDIIKTKSNYKSKQQIVKDLIEATKKYKNILLATDEDREGEMIAWSLAKVLNISNPQRITFNSITKNEILKAIQNPRNININLVYAQQTRRILDRIVGFEISPLLWKNIKGSLSAGRVQSVITKIIIDREEEINKFYKNNILSYFKFNGIFNNNLLKANLYKLKDENYKITLESLARDIMHLLTLSQYKITNINQKESIRNPCPPFQTSTLQQEAGIKLNLPVKITMKVAQNLYEAGYITYIRTDSVNLSNEAMISIKKYILDKFGKNYYRQFNYKSKSVNSQEAHEAIRPTDINIENLEMKDNIGKSEQRLYNLIWKRTIASQMTPAKFNIMDITINISKLPDYYFLAKLEELIFYGYLKVYNLDREDFKENIKKKDLENYNIIPKIHTILQVNNITCFQDYEKPITRYNEPSLVKQLEKLGIGRPATYATNISNIQSRKYVVIGNIDGIVKNSLILKWDGNNKDVIETIDNIILGKETKKLIPTPMGIKVNEFLITNFPNIVDYNFTYKMEENLDIIAEGKQDKFNIIDKFYKEFHPIVEKINNNNNKNLDNNLRLLGKDPKSKLDIFATIAKYGPVVKKNTTKTKCIYASILEPLKLETITLNDALKLLEYPKNLGKYNRKLVMLKNGKNGLYISYNKIFINLTKCGYDTDIDLDLAISLIKEREELIKNKFNNKFNNKLNDDKSYNKYKKNNKLDKNKNYNKYKKIN